MDESELLLSLMCSAFFFVLGWLIGIERKTKMERDLELWKAYSKELEKKTNK
tara:strand:- start:411 stop:566 length:156 start_codon:yes stop_codon:yes gene_type:complete